MPILPENAVALGRIGGPLLDRNLKRKNAGAGEENLSFGSTSVINPNVLYLDVINGRVGINTDTPTHPLRVNNIRTTNLIVPTQTEIQNFVITNNTIQNISTTITFSPNQATNPIIDMVKIGTYDYGSSVAYLNISDQLIENVKNNSNIELSPNGTGEVNVTTSKLYVDGNFTATGNITWNGSLITLGSNDQDNVVFNADIDSDVVPNINETYDLGTALKQWNKIYTKDIPVSSLNLDNLEVNGVDFLLQQGNTIYVSVNGSDTNVGTHLHNTYKTIKKALSVAVAGDTVVIFPGTYEEIFPLTVPAGVTVNGAGIRAVTVVPTIGTQDKDCFLMNGETTISHLTVKNFFYNSTNNTGYAFRFANNATVTSRSPYVQNVTVITLGSSVPGEIYVDPVGLGLSFDTYGVTITKSGHSEALVQSWVGKTLVTYFGPSFPVTFYTITGYESSVQDPTQLWNLILAEPFNPLQQGFSFSIYPSGTTFILPPNDYDMTGASIGEPWVAYYKTNLPADFNTVVGSGWSINNNGVVYVIDYVIEDPINTNMWRIYVTTSLVPASGIPIFSSPAVSQAGNGALVDGSAVTSSSKEASMLFHSVTMIVPNGIGIHATNGARVEWLDSFTYFAEKGIYLTQGTLGFASLGVRFGAEMRSIGSANVYGTYGAVADGVNTIGYLIQHNFAYIGTGTNSFNDAGLVVQANEVVELNNGKIYFESIDHKGDFRIGDIFYVNQETGRVIFNAQSINFTASGNITLTGPTSLAILDATGIQVSNIRISGNTIASLAGPINFLSASSTTTLNTNVFVTGNANITADILVKGNLYLGNQATDTITIYPEFTQDLLPDDVGGPYTLGTNLKRWDTLYTSKLEIDGVVQIDNNTIETLTTNTNLLLQAAGTGKVNFEDTDVEINNDLTVANNLTINGLSTLLDTEVIGTTTHVGNWGQTGNIDLTGDATVNVLKVSGLASYFTVPDFKFEDNEISVTATNQNLVLLGTGTGGVVLEEVLKIAGTTFETLSGSTVTTLESGEILTTEDGTPYAFEGITNTSENITFVPNGAGSFIIDTTKALKIPVGNNTTRTLTAGEIRYNNVTNLFEGGGATGGLISFNGLYDSDRNTYITTGGLDNTIYFGISNNVKARIDSTALKTDRFDIGKVRFENNTISNYILDNDLFLLPTGTGNTQLNNISFSSASTITNQLNSPLIIKGTGTGYISFANSAAVMIPMGLSSERPATAEIGQVRYNTTFPRLEVYTGDPSQGENGWVTALGEATGIVDANIIEGLLDFWTLILG